MKLVKCLTNSVKIYNFATETKQVKGYRKWEKEQSLENSCCRLFVPVWLSADLCNGHWEKIMRVLRLRCFRYWVVYGTSRESVSRYWQNALQKIKPVWPIWWIIWRRKDMCTVKKIPPTVVINWYSWLPKGRSLKTRFVRFSIRFMYMQKRLLV